MMEIKIDESYFNISIFLLSKYCGVQPVASIGLRRCETPKIDFRNLTL